MVAQAINHDQDEERDGVSKVREALAGLPHREEWILASDLEIDHSYQRRHVRQAWVEEIAKNFDPDLLRPLLVNRRGWANGRLFVMDGQHRLLAIRLMGWGDQLVPCIVYDNLAYEVEAKLFDTQASSKPPNAQERFRSALQRREADEEIVDALVRKAGYQLNLDHGDLTEGRIAGVAALLKILRRQGSAVLDEVLVTCADGFGTEIGPHARILDGMARFLGRYRKHDHFDGRRLVAVLRKARMNQIAADAVGVKKQMNCSADEAIGFVIHKFYNTRLQDERRLPDWTFGKRRRER